MTVHAQAATETANVIRIDLDPALQQALYDRSPYNTVRLILNKETPQDTETDNRYTRSANLLRDWQRENILVQDSARCVYVYHQDFEVEGRRYTLAVTARLFRPGHAGQRPDDP